MDILSQGLVNRLLLGFGGLHFHKKKLPPDVFDTFKFIEQNMQELQLMQWKAYEQSARECG